MHNKEKARIAAEIKAFKNTDFSDCPEMTDEQLAHSNFQAIFFANLTHFIA
jgi:hypothetical protein